MRHIRKYEMGAGRGEERAVVARRRLPADGPRAVSAAGKTVGEADVDGRIGVVAPLVEAL